MSDTTTVFQSGNSQAVRLPKEFRFKSKTVEIFRRGDEVVLREKPRTMGEVLSENGFDLLGPPSAEELRDHDKMMAMIRAPQPPDHRVWDALWGPHAVPHEAELPKKAATARKPRRPRKG